MDPLDFTVERIDQSSNAIISNLFEYYLHDMAEWFRFDTGDDGRYHYDMAPHWQRGDEVYLLRCARKARRLCAGDVGQAVAERCGRLRRRGILRRAPLSAHRRRRRAREERSGRCIRAQWLVRVYEGNVPAIPFWRKIIARYANDRQIEERRIVNGKAWSFFHFKSAAA